MRTVFACVAALGIQGALAEVEEAIKWQTPQEVLAAIDAGEAPKKPQVWQSPRGPLVLHGDLFGDGRHLALVGTAGASWAVAKKGVWEVAGQLDAWPAWVPPGTAIDDERYIAERRCNAPGIPFVLKDLDGDRVPEVLIIFNNDGYNTGYTIARKDGKGIKLVDLRSEHGEPEWKGGYLVVTTYIWGRKAWGSGDTYFKWREGVPVPVATWINDCSDLDVERWIAVRHEPGGKDRAFELIQDDEDAWAVRSCHWESGDETSDEKDFAKIVVSEKREDPENPNSGEVQMALIFELATGISGSVTIRRPLVSEDFDFAKEAARFEVKIEGSDGAKDTLKRVSK